MCCVSCVTEMEGFTRAEERSGEDTNAVTICATVTSGFEHLATQECGEKFGSGTCPRLLKKFRGRILFDIPYHEVEKATQLRAVDNLSVLVGHLRDVDLSQDKERAVGDLCEEIGKSSWKLALDTWRVFTQSELCLDPLPKSSSSSECSDDHEEGGQASRPTFRVTCTRTGKNHAFSSRDVAPAVGSLVNETFGWPVRMKEYDIEVVVNVLEDSVLVALSLTRESMHRRNISHFGLTTLKSTIAYCMLRMAQPKPGEVICDPMCGVGAIPLEGLMDWTTCYILSGDINDVAVERTKANMDSERDKRKSGGVTRSDLANDVFKWDVTNLPLKSASLDIIVSDLPFGKRMGNRRSNWSLYHQCLEEMARVCRPGTSRAVLLTQDKKCMAQTLQRCGYLWRKKNFIFINHGGLRACVYLLQRAKFKDKRRVHLSQEARPVDEEEECDEDGEAKVVNQDRGEDEEWREES